MRSKRGSATEAAPVQESRNCWTTAVFFKYVTSGSRAIVFCEILVWSTELMDGVAPSQPKTVNNNVLAV